MSVSPLARADALRIGTVDFVSPDEIMVLLELDAPDVVALNTGSPRAFPRVNGYVLIPSDGGHLVGQIEWITVEHSPYPKRKGMQDFGLIDLPYPLRKLSVNPLGVLRCELDNGSATHLRFRRGVDAYPTVGQPVLLPTTEQLTSIVESGQNRHVQIGISPLAADAKVCVDPDRLFGRHLAVLGNTGSGKSCSVAGLIRWSIESASYACTEGGNASGPNARFIVLDPNGEYGSAFDDLDSSVEVRRFGVEPDDRVDQLQAPLWFWNSEEWCAFTQAAPRAQRPVLVQALRTVRDGAVVGASTRSSDDRRYLRTLVTALMMSKSTGDPWRVNGSIKGFRDRLKVWTEGVRDSAQHTHEESEAIRRLRDAFDSALADRTQEWPKAFTRECVDDLIQHAREAHSAFGGGDTDSLPFNADTPRPFKGEDLLRSIEANAELLDVVAYIETMLIRVRTLLSDARMREIIEPSGAATLVDWLNTYIGDNRNEKASITVIDLSLVPAEVVHVVTAVIARMVLEAQQRYRKFNGGKVLPTVLVMEEAHTFVKRYKEDLDNQSTAAICCQVFEKIAREGRKFGLGLVLSSQRPSELSPTVLSQCNTFLLHRISNDRDQDLIHKLVPDNLRGLLRDLPSLPAKQAVLLGWASELPTLVEMRHLERDHRPLSADPDFWDVWTRKREPPVEWSQIALDWQNYVNEITPGEAAKDVPR